MGIHDRDWYREERKQERAKAPPRADKKPEQAAPSSSPPEPAPSVRVPIRQTGSLPHVRYTPLGLPLWFMAIFWAVVLVGLLAVFQSYLKP